MTKPFPAKWPKEFDPDSSSISAESFLIEQMTEEASPPKLHRHTTGQLSITLNGHAGIVLQEDIGEFRLLALHGVQPELIIAEFSAQMRKSFLHTLIPNFLHYYQMYLRDSC